MVEVKWVRLYLTIRPKDFISEIAPLLPKKYYPLLQNGNGNRGLYLAQISSELEKLLIGLISKADGNFPDAFLEAGNEIKETKIEEKIGKSNLTETVRKQLIEARIGQGLFRANVEDIETGCRVTGLSDKRLLVASHIKPWRDCTNVERLDGYNGFLMSPHVDKLFDRGWISFSEKGQLLVAHRDIRQTLSVWAIDENKQVGKFSKEQKGYLEYYRDKVFKW